MTQVSTETSETGTATDKVFHYVHRAQALAGFVEGSPVSALCGETFVPSRWKAEVNCDTCLLFRRALA